MSQLHRRQVAEHGKRSQRGARAKHGQASRSRPRLASLHERHSTGEMSSRKVSASCIQIRERRSSSSS